MEPQSPHISLIYDEAVPEVLFNDFREAVRAPSLSVHLQSRPSLGPLASPVWVIPTAVIVFISQGYFNGFLGEMGKGHFVALKSALRDLRERFSYVKVTLIGTPGKVSKDQPYSQAFSICFHGNQMRSIKFLVPAGEGPSEEIDRIIYEFSDFLAEFYAGKLDPGHVRMFEEAQAYGGTLLVAFNSATGRIEPIHPGTHKFEHDR